MNNYFDCNLKHLIYINYKKKIPYLLKLFLLIRYVGDFSISPIYMKTNVHFLQRIESASPISVTQSTNQIESNLQIFTLSYHLLHDAFSNNTRKLHLRWHLCSPERFPSAAQPLNYISPRIHSHINYCHQAIINRFTTIYVSFGRIEKACKLVMDTIIILIIEIVAEKKINNNKLRFKLLFAFLDVNQLRRINM